MINYLQGCFNNTPIGMLPTIINHNNLAIEDEFNWIFDSSLNRLTKSVYVPTGSVTAHNGEFVNLLTEFITIKNIDSLVQNVMPKVIESINEDITNAVNEYFTEDDHKLHHSSLDERFVTLPEEVSKYAHDAAIICTTNGENVQTTLDSLNSNITSINNYIINNDISILDLNNSVNNAISIMNILNTSISTVSRNINSSIQYILDNFTSILENLNVLDVSVNIIDSSIEELYANIEELNVIDNSINNIDVSISVIHTNINNITNLINIIDSRVLNVEASRTIRFINVENYETTLGACNINMYEYNILQLENDQEMTNIYVILNNTTLDLIGENSTIKKYYVKIQNFEGTINFLNIYEEKLNIYVDDNMSEYDEVECLRNYCYEFEITEHAEYDKEIGSLLVHIRKYKMQ